MSASAIDSILAKPLPTNGAMGQARRFAERTGRMSGVSGLRRHLNALAAADPEAIRTEVIARGRDPFIHGLVDSLSETGRYCSTCERSGRERWAFRLYAELAKLVGSGTEIAVQIVNLVGAQPVEARRAVDFTREVEAYAEDEPALMAKLAGELSAYMARTGVSFEILCAKASGAEVL